MSLHRATESTLKADDIPLTFDLNMTRRGVLRACCCAAAVLSIMIVQGQKGKSERETRSQVVSRSVLLEQSQQRPPS
jgi:hypothetical protein